MFDSGDMFTAFRERFGGAAPVVARAPGRVNLIGEHTDYNEGFVLPMALEQNTWVAAAARGDGRVVVAADSLGDTQEWPVGGWSADAFPAWTRYVAGVETLIRAATGWADGARLLIRSDVPVGGGLSSSAALEVSTALALATLAGLEIRGSDLADLARRAEHEFAHVPCGIMDQYVSVLGKAGHALLLDCRDRTWAHVPLRLEGAAILVVNSGVRHALAAGAYAARQRECQQALAFFQHRRPEVRALRDVTPADVRQNQTSLGPLLAARARHVTSENERTLAAAEALRAGDLAGLGQLLFASHRSLRDDYQVSCPELDRLVDILGATRGAYGARLTGAGFGGCVVAVVESTAVPATVAAVRRDYDAAGFGPAEVIRSRPGAGAAVVRGAGGSDPVSSE